MLENELARVLVVDDIQSNIDFVTDVLELENLDIIGAYSGAQAIELAQHENPDIILLDISMPEMDGYEVCQHLKDNEKTKHIPIIFLTARVQKEDIIKGFELGAVDYIIKPFNFNELISRVRTHIDLKQKTEKLQTINLELESKVEKRTEQLRIANTELQEANKKLTNANNELSKLDKTKTEFVLHINHELRTPLNGIQGYINILSESSLDETQAESLKSIKVLTNRLIRVAELSLLFTELKTNENQIDIRPVDFIGSLNDAIDNRDKGAKNIEIEIENPFDKVNVLAEQKLLISCLSIVIDNAIKYSPETGKVIISLKRYHEYIELTILDEGPGFSEKAQEDLFSFFAADNLQQESYGFGVGLATAKLILDLIKGSIEIANRDPKGALVRLKFLEAN
jgi:two-component system sensor histidine kinase/response regulator